MGRRLRVYWNSSTLAARSSLLAIVAGPCSPCNVIPQKVSKASSRAASRATSDRNWSMLSVVSKRSWISSMTETRSRARSLSTTFARLEAGALRLEGAMWRALA